MCTLFCAFNTCVSCITFFLGLAASHSSKDPPSLAYWLFASPQLISVRRCCRGRAERENVCICTLTCVSFWGGVIDKEGEIKRWGGVGGGVHKMSACTSHFVRKTLRKTSHNKTKSHLFEFPVVWPGIRVWTNKKLSWRPLWNTCGKR